MDEEGLVWFGAWSPDTRYTPPPQCWVMKGWYDPCKEYNQYQPSTLASPVSSTVQCWREGTQLLIFVVFALNKQITIPCKQAAKQSINLSKKSTKNS